ncbi:hypothetical protein VT84_13880 [Gemmata sp. SH-PL17]|uniref:hypothetical protein n=1 Tax=Gemmata sp. SH-PL17 TaxID=1630693 RepID=UPI00078B49D4|nr:hypothetical protein [Gemmata sp. SH-PL17]AMV25483.1 hypothetical protein VT84_13880 [Gemmata sp. SH-PL17]
MTPPLIRMPNGDAIRADQVVGVRALGQQGLPDRSDDPRVIIDTPNGCFCHETGSMERAHAERDRIIAEVNAATGGAVAEPTVVVTTTPA